MRAAYHVGDRRIEAVLVFDAAGDLVDFVSDDRSMASSNGRSFTRLRWSTPVLERAADGAGRVGAGSTSPVVLGEARWHPAEGSAEESTEEPFTYIELRCTAYEAL